MVNTGHPSRACKLCRKRRIKCDETKPGCLKCKKAQKQCPGYRDAFEIKLRDETQSTIRKAKAAAEVPQAKTDCTFGSLECTTLSSPSAVSPVLDWETTPVSESTNVDLSMIRSRSDTDLSSSTDSVNGSISPSFSGTRPWFESQSPLFEPSPVSPLLLGLQTPLDEQATCFFLSSFVLNQSPGNQNYNLFSFILRILGWGGINDTPFPMAFTAVCLAAFAGRPDARHLLQKSRIYYSTALLQLKEAIKDEARAKHDTSLATAILLSLYEGLACESDSMVGWSNHLDGAKALLRVRGKGVIKDSSAEGVEMFQLVRSMSIRQYMFGFVANPAPGECEWWGEHLIAPKSGHVALMLNMKATLIRAEADSLFASESKTADKVEKALELLGRAREIVVELGHWFDHCHPTWPKFVSGWAAEVTDDKLSKAPAFPGPIFAFPNIWVAGKHLNINASRIMLSAIVVRCLQWICSPSDHTQTDDYAEAMRVGVDEVANVVASVPYFVNWTGDKAATMPDFPCGTSTTPKAYSAVTALYPLLCTGLSVFATRRQKTWLCYQLNTMSETMGIKQAGFFAQLISQQQQS
ncbi:hypothetical protein BD289DRAFT_402951 [Coniella lustricola]|uniref:Zn(2)-C6 fungal-type domain-containing protein n=1 Tax=Coniella lustricola TaxID=2025994 RepID=A0A2T3AIF3_9PEZI|nr:hypothetical protein BD289DRAFT_402951 [Coniella lustricola]